MFAISRIEFYKFSQCGAVFAEARRTLARYDNPDWRPEDVERNFSLVVPKFQSSIEDYILSKKKEYRCRMSLDPALPEERQTNVMGQVLFSGSPELFDGLDYRNQIDYFSNCLNFFTDKYPDAEIVSAVVHYDETTPHLHVNFLPTIKKQTDKGERTVFSSSQMFPGKNAFAEYQEAFYGHMNSLYPEFGLQRKGEEERPHLTVKEYKQLKDENNPSLQMKLENARLREENSTLRKTLLFIREKIPAVRVIVDKILCVKER